MWKKGEGMGECRGGMQLTHGWRPVTQLKHLKEGVGGWKEWRVCGGGRSRLMGSMGLGIMARALVHLLQDSPGKELLLLGGAWIEAKHTQAGCTHMPHLHASAHNPSSDPPHPTPPPDSTHASRPFTSGTLPHVAHWSRAMLPVDPLAAPGASSFSASSLVGAMALLRAHPRHSAACGVAWQAAQAEALRPWQDGARGGRLPVAHPSPAAGGQGVCTE